MISLVGVRTHNLRNIDVDIPLDLTTLVVGPSGSGKSSLAFGTVHALAHAAYLEGISSYSRFTETRLATPEVEDVQGLRPTIALAQGYGARTSRSTVGTVTDALALVRLLFSRLGQPVVSAGQLSFTNPTSVCEVCNGAGTELRPVESRLLDPARSLDDGAILHRAWKVGGRYWNIIKATERVPLDVAVGELSQDDREFLLRAPAYEVNNDNPGFVQRFTYEGIIPRLRKRVSDARDLGSRSYDLSFFDQLDCTGCAGTRLNALARGVTVDGHRFDDTLRLELTDLQAFIEGLDEPVAAPIRTRLTGLFGRMIDLGLGHLTLLRPTTTVSGGELRRVRIAHQLTSPLSGLIYVVDEAGAGLQHTEARAVYESLAALSRRGNTVLLVDHSDGARAVAEYVIELGPGGGSEGGQLVWAGPIDKYEGPYGLAPVVQRVSRQVTPKDPHFTVAAHSHNLRPVQVEVPKNRFVVLVGPSGSGKTSLAIDIAAQVPDCALLSQRDIGGSVRSVLATYLNVFDPIRKLFADRSGLAPADFSFNGAGACPTCGGWGYLKMEMQFLEDVITICEECRGQRYRPDVLEIRVDGRSIADVLSLTVDQATAAFARHRTIAHPLHTASAVGIGHLVLGQSTDTLSGGEAQRLRISTEVAQTGRAVLILDEPTRGLGYAEVPRFVALVDRVLDEGRSVIAIEHNLAVIAAADWIIELGPGSGHQGGRVLVAGTVADVMAAGTTTGQALAEMAGAP